MMILSEIDSASSGMMSLLLVFCAVVIMVMLLRRRQTGGGSRREMAHGQMSRIRDQRELRGSVDELLVQLEDVARRVGAEVETRFAKLEAVIRDADSRIAALRNLSENADVSQVAAPSAPACPPAATPRRPETRTTRATPPTASETPKRGNQRVGSADGDPRFKQVYELADSGAPPIKVAEQLGLPLGEVELILNLRRIG